MPLTIVGEMDAKLDVRYAPKIANLKNRKSRSNPTVITTEHAYHERAEPATFLSRYHNLLNIDDLHNFANEQDDYEIQHYVNSIKMHAQKSMKHQSVENRKLARQRAEVKNRRYVMLRRMIGDGEYFSDWEMRQRAPLLYEQMIGQYLNDEAMFADYCENSMRCERLQMERANEELNEMCCAEKRTDGEFDSDQTTSSHAVGNSGAKTKDDDGMESDESELESDAEEAATPRFVH
ncbi:unnamed protein product [Sphagnum balticum]